MKNYLVYFKDVPDPLPLACDAFKLVTKFNVALEEGTHRWFEFYKDDPAGPERLDIFIQFGEVAAIVPSDYDPSAPGFQVYLKGQRLPLTVKAHKLDFTPVGETLQFVSDAPNDPIPGTRERRPGFKPIPDIHLLRSEVLAVLPEDVTEGEAGEEEEVDEDLEEPEAGKLPAPVRTRARGK